MRPRERRLGLIWRFFANRIAGLTITTGTSAEKGDSEDLTTITEAFLVEVEGMMLLRIQGQQRRLRCRNDGP